MKRSIFDLVKNALTHKKPSSFGEHRAQRMEDRLQKAITQRRTLARAQAAAEEPINQHLEQRGNMVANKIGRLQSDLAKRRE